MPDEKIWTTNHSDSLQEQWDHTVVSYQNEVFHQNESCLLGLSLLHNLREDGGQQGSSHFDEKLSFWYVTTVSQHGKQSIWAIKIILPWHPARHSTAAWCSTKSPLWLQVKLLLWLKEWWGPHKGRERWNKQLFLSFEPLCTWWQKAKGNRRLGMPSAESLVIQGHLQCCLFAWVHCAYKKGGRQKLLN